MSINWSTCRRHTAGGLPFKLVSGPEIQHGEDGSTATETYLMPAANIAAFMYESLPPPYVFGFYIILPDRRRMPGCPWFVTQSMSCRPQSDQLPGDPFNVDSAADPYPYDPDYLVQIQYKVTKEADTQRNQQQPETFLEHSLQAGGEFYSIGKDRLRYSEDGNEVGGTLAGQAISEENMPGAHLSVATLEHTLKWPFALAPDWATFFSCLGKVNSAASVLFNNAPVETVLFSSISGQQKYVWNGASASVQPWTLDFKFSQRVMKDGATDITWNHVYHANAHTAVAKPVNVPKWVKPFWLSGNTKKYMYETADLYGMFKTA